MAARLFTKHDSAAQTSYQELKQLARSQARVLAGTPGTMRRRTRKNTDYWVREYIRVDGRRDEDYLGTIETLSEQQVEALQASIDLAKGLAGRSAKLRLFNYQRIERKAGAVLAALYNRGLFGAGLTLVGSHAYAILLNDLGLVAPGYRTQDVDVARAQPLAIALPDGLDFRTVLRESGLHFVAVPGMPAHEPSASFKLPGAETLAVDLLAPGREIGRTVPVAELRTHAQSIPLLEYLLKDSTDSVALSPNGAVPVKVPSPERYALHKLFSSQSRRSDRDKSRKDLDQAAVLAAALEDEVPGMLTAAYGELPKSAKDTLRRGARAAARLLKETHPHAHEILMALGTGTRSL